MTVFFTLTFFKKNSFHVLNIRVDPSSLWACAVAPQVGTRGREKTKEAGTQMWLRVDVMIQCCLHAHLFICDHRIFCLFVFFFFFF
jgi:hypothetical protein